MMTTGRMEQPEDESRRRRRRDQRDLQESDAGRMEQLVDVGRSDPASSGLNDYATFSAGRRVSPMYGTRSYLQSPRNGPDIHNLM